MSGLFALAGFQKQASDAIQETLCTVAARHMEFGHARQEIARRSAVTLLQAPTGSGKTLILGRALEAIRGKLPMPVVWFWFAPYAGLVTQTISALADQCPSLSLRDVTRDRVSRARDGDVFLQTWASVAARDKDARRARRTSESVPSLDDLLMDLRASGHFIGVVVDEAHLNFGASAVAAAEFYLDVLKPDFTLLSTATPNDEKLVDFERRAGIEVASRIIVSRPEVVRAGLNKAGLMLGVIRYSAEDADLIDVEQATLSAGLTQHRRVQARLQELGVQLTPLMLVQVEDQAGGADPVERVRAKLLEIGVADEAIAVHTSGEPDPDFHTLAYDPLKEVLIFKVAVATGFDAPRAWTLVSVRPSRGKDFGLQIVGRIMRVHPAVRALPGDDPLLDRGYVFLTSPDMQTGLITAVDELKAVRQSIELITDRLDLITFQPSSGQGVPEGRPTPPANSIERHERLEALIQRGLVAPVVRSLEPAQQDAAIVQGEVWRAISETPLFGGELPLQPVPPAQTTAARRTYPLRNDLGLPSALIREMPPRPDEASGLVEDIAQEFCRSAAITSLLQKKLSRAQLTFHDLFLEQIGETVDLRLRLSNARIAQKAQMAFDFNDSIDPRRLKVALVNALRTKVDDAGIEADERDLRRAIDLAVMSDPARLREAMRLAQSRHVVLSNAEAIPPAYIGPADLPIAVKGAYGVFPERLNNEERSFAELLDNDQSGVVLWWLRNPENERWATRLVLPSGKIFFPDFVVGVSRRTTPHGIALVEIKDDGETGRLQSDRNLEKIRVQHREYRNVFWTYRTDGSWVRATYAEGLHRIVPHDAFRIEELVYLQ